jgi:type II secretory pathway pseudopilin PulG
LSRNNADPGKSDKPIESGNPVNSCVSGVICNREREAGFTVIELLIAFTILAIVSGSLFQMLYVSAWNNSKAEAKDIANGLAITAAENFKTYYGASEINAGIGTSIDTGAGVGGYIKYYDRQWNEIYFYPLTYGTEDDISINVATSIAVHGGGDILQNGMMEGGHIGVFSSMAAESYRMAPNDAVYALEVICCEEGDDIRELENIAAPLSLALDSSMEYRLVVNETGGEIEALFNGVPYSAGKSINRRIVSIDMDFVREGTLPKHIVVLNRTALTVNINIFGIPGADFTAMGGAEDSVPGDYVEVSPIMGSIGVMYMSGAEKIQKSATRIADITVRELSNGGAEITRVTARKYIPG